MKNNNFTSVKIILCFLLAGGVLFFPVSAMAGIWTPESQTIEYVVEIFSNTCLLCVMIEGMLKAMSEYAEIAKDILIDPAQKLLGLGLAFWILTHTMKNIAIMGFMESGVAEYLRSLFNRLFLTVIVAGFLNSWGGTTGVVELFNAVLAPIFYLGVAFSNEFLAASLPSGGGVAVTAYFATPDLCSFVTGSMTDGAGNAIEFDVGSKIISEDIINATVCIIGQIGAFLKTGLVACWILLNLAFVKAPFGLFLMPVAAVLGIIIFGYPYISMMLYVPMYLIEALIRVMLVGAFLPLFAVACVFPSTRPFSLKAINIVITSSLVFMFIGMFVGISTQFLIKIYSKLRTIFLYDDDGEKIIDSLLKFSVEEVAVMVIMPFLLMSMLGKAEKFAQYFGGVPFKRLNFVSGAAKVAQGAVATTVITSSNAYRKAGGYANRSRQMMGALRGRMQKRSALNSYNSGGGDGPQSGAALMANGPSGPTNIPPFNGGAAASDNASDNLASAVDSKFHDVLGMNNANKTQSSSDVADSAWEDYKKSQEITNNDDEGTA